MSQSPSDSGEIIDALRCARIMARRTQEDVAGNADMGQPDLSKIEKGTRRATLEQACLIARALGYRVVVVPAFGTADTEPTRSIQAVAS